MPHHKRSPAAEKGEHPEGAGSMLGLPATNLIMSSAARAAATADTTSSGFAGVFAMLAPHMAELDRFLRAQLPAFEPEIRPMVESCLDTSGKRIRPALVFLSGWRGVGEIAPDLVQAAAVVELV